MARPSVAAEERFWAKIPNRPIGRCWEWHGARTAEGYGVFAPTHATKISAHRFAYILSVGIIPEGLTLDHLCRNPPCCNPTHLEPVTMRENLLRGVTFQALNAAKTHCLRGHPFDVENTRVRSTGSRQCRACDRIRHRKA